MSPKEAFHKLQNQPEATRKMIVWTVTIVFGILLFFWWFSKIQIQVPNVREQLENIPIDTQING